MDSSGCFDVSLRLSLVLQAFLLVAFDRPLIAQSQFSFHNPAASAGALGSHASPLYTMSVVPFFSNASVVVDGTQTLPSRPPTDRRPDAHVLVSPHRPVSSPI